MLEDITLLTAMSTHVKQKLSKGENVYGTCIVSTSPIWSRAVRDLDLDFVFIDTEHLPIDRTELTYLCQIYVAYGIAPIVRIPSPDPYLACMVCDAGAQGVLAPYIEEVSQVQQLVGATKYRPLKGKKLQQVIQKEEPLSPDLDHYLKKYNQDCLCLINIESTVGLENLNQLLEVPGLDGVVIGPHDLSINMELPEQYEHPDFKSAVELVITRARKHKKAVGIHFPTGPERQIEWAEKGANIILHSSDFFLFRDKLTEDLQTIKKAIGDKAVGGTHSDLVI